MNENGATNLAIDGDLFPALQIVRREYDKAKLKHPVFPVDLDSGISITTEELGELSREFNDGKPGWRERAIIESAHVAVTAIRAMEALMAYMERFGAEVPK